MQFILNSQNITFNDFEKLMPESAKILAPFQASEQSSEWVFVFIGEAGRYRLGLKFKDFSSWSIDINSQLEYHKVYFFKNSPFKEQLAKALGIKNNQTPPKVLDATAGTLSDSILIKSFGVTDLTCFERHPVIAALIQSLGPQKYGINFSYGSAKDCLGEFDVVYFDPMYHEINKKASPKKEMQIFRQLIGPDEDALEVAEYLKTLATDRLVIKRSTKAAPLMSGANHSIIGKSTAYDVYLTKI